MPRWTFLLSLVLAAASSAADKPKPVLVVPLHSGPGVEQNIADLITDTLSADIQKETGRPILTQKDVQAMLGVERQKALVGCSENASCLTEIAGALSAPQLVHGTLGRLGDTWVLNLSLIDATTGAVSQRYSSRKQGSTAEVFLEESPAAVQQLFGGGAGASIGSSGAGKHLLFASLRGVLGVPPESLSSLTYFGAAFLGAQLTRALDVSLGALFVRGGGAVARVGFVPVNAGGAFKPVLALEVPVVFGPALALGVSFAPGFHAEVTPWLSLGVDVPITYFPVAPAGVPSFYVFGAASAAVRFL